MTDIKPRTVGWKRIIRQYQSLCGYLNPVDARDSPRKLHSSSRRKSDFKFDNRLHQWRGGQPGPHRSFRLFNQCFSDFDNQQSTDILRDTLNYSDGFAIAELQERRLGALIMEFFNALGILIFNRKVIGRKDSEQ